MNFSLTMHNVIEVVLGPVKEDVLSSGKSYASRVLEIKTKDGDFEIVLFSLHVDGEHKEKPLRVKV